jgi:CBS domain-containing protein
MEEMGMALKVKHVMRKEVMTVAPSESLDIANRLMSVGELRRLPVVSGNAVVGILTRGDILRVPERLAPGREFGSDTRALLRGLRVQDAMTRSVVTIGPEASVNEAVEHLLRHRVQCLPVIADGRLVGLFADSDLLRAFASPGDVTSARGAPISSAPAHTAASHP